MEKLILRGEPELGRGHYNNQVGVGPTSRAHANLPPPYRCHVGRESNPPEPG